MLKVLGAAGSYSHESKATSFLIGKNIVIDAGNIVQGLGEECCNVEHIFISHTHFDHIVDLPFVIESYFECRQKPLKVYALSESIHKLQEHIFNWSIWPDFQKITLKNSEEESLQFIPVEYGETVKIDDIEVTIIEANHTVPTCGYKVKKADQAFILSGDTYINSALIDLINNDESISSLLIDVSFSSDKEELAEKSKHLTPKLLEKMLLRLQRNDVAIYAYHQKPFFTQKINNELTALNLLKNRGKHLESGDLLDLFTPLHKRQDVRNHESQNNEKNHLKNLFKIAQTMQAELDTSILLEMIVEQAKTFTHADAATLYLLSGDKKELVFKVSHNDTLNTHIDSLHNDVEWSNLPLYFEDIQANVQMVAVLAALNKKTIIIDDIYDRSEFDFAGTKQFDKNTGYRSRSMLVVPLLDHENETIGVLQLINKKNIYGETVFFDTFDKESTSALASQASVAIVNATLIKSLEEAFEVFIRTIARAIDTKSHHTGEHVRRVAKITNMIAEAIDKSDEGPYKDVRYSDEDLKQIYLAALLHDVGKIATPGHIMEKKNKLETIIDRIELIDERIEILKRDIKIKYLEHELKTLKDQKSVPSDLREREAKELMVLDDIRSFLRQCNIGSEFLEDDKILYLQMLAKKIYQIDGEDVQFLRGSELENLSIRKGTLTDEERNIIRNHANATIEILSAIPFPKALNRVLNIACNHHEKLDGTGYPRQLKGDELTLEDRILILADMFEALSASNRSYKTPNSMSEIAAIMQDLIDRGHMDKQLVQFFFETGIYREYACSELNAKQQDIAELNFD
ncbi:HD domain-containing phosphohydrolase [Sulfurovum sp. CS9]|uniref:HD domain-containing phosphohydrolase n=1 Tax=Sulfurovum sp. CS9 TaxID=3391146 RepID=UPI0039EB368D